MAPPRRAGRASGDGHRVAQPDDGSFGIASRTFAEIPASAAATHRCQGGALLAMLAEAKVVVHAWLRSGNSASARGVTSFMAETLARLPADFRLYALRADSGFFIAEFLAYLGERLLPYVIAVRMDPRIKHVVAGLRHWTPFAPGLEAAETSYQALGWKAPRRLVARYEGSIEPTLVRFSIETGAGKHQTATRFLIYSGVAPAFAATPVR